MLPPLFLLSLPVVVGRCCCFCRCLLLLLLLLLLVVVRCLLFSVAVAAAAGVRSRFDSRGDGTDQLSPVRTASACPIGAEI